MNGSIAKRAQAGCLAAILGAFALALVLCFGGTAVGEELEDYESEPGVGLHEEE